MSDIKEKMMQIGQMAKEATEDMRKLSAADRYAHSKELNYMTVGWIPDCPKEQHE